MDRLIKKGNIILRAVPGRRTLSVKVCGFPSYFYSPDNNSHNNNNNQSNSKCTSVRFFTTRRRKGNQLRVAIIGGGAAGLSSALHLAPLVESGMIAAPIDVSTRATLREINLALTENGKSTFPLFAYTILIAFFLCRDTFPLDPG